MWGFETDPEFAEKLAWADDFVRTEVMPLRYLLKTPLDLNNPVRQEIVPPLQQQVKDAGLWACHLGPELGGPGYGQLKLALLNEILGMSGNGSSFAPVVFGTQAPDSGNAEVIAHFGTPEQKERYLQPLLAGTMFSCFSMTEPQGGSDPGVFTTSARRDGDGWIINGEKWFSSNARWSEFLLVLAVTDPEERLSRRMSMFLVPRSTPGVEIVRNVEIPGWTEERGGDSAYVRYTDVRVAEDQLLGGPGDGFLVAQTRLGGGRIHHCMRAVGQMKLALEMMKERAVSRTTKGGPLADKQLVQVMIADTWAEIEQYRLLVLQTAWRLDQYGEYDSVRADIAAVKALAPGIMQRIATRALQLHGSLGLTEEMPFLDMLVNGLHVGLADGPTEVHKLNLARTVLRGTEPAEGLFPSAHIPAAKAAVREKYADVIARHPGASLVE